MVTKIYRTILIILNFNFVIPAKAGIHMMVKNVHQYYVYILANKKNGTLYIGISNDLERRIAEHKNKQVDGFTKKYSLDQLVYFETYQYINDAILREKRLKKWKRQWKIDLIEEDNSEWNDLASDWFD